MDPKTRRAWETALESRDEVENAQGNHPSFDTLTDFLGRRCRMIQALEQPQTSRSTTGLSLASDTRKIRVCATVSAAAVIYTACKGSHHTSRCASFKQVPLEERKAITFRAKLCYNCLGGSHLARNCPSQSTCRNCGGLHHTLLHDGADKRVLAPQCTPGFPPRSPKNPRP